MLVIRNSVFLMIISGVSLIGLAGWFSFDLIENQVKEAKGETLSSVLQITQQGLDTWAKESKQTVNAFSSSEGVIALSSQLLETPQTHQALLNAPALGQLREVLAPALESHKLRGFLIISPDNIVLASGRDEQIGKENDYLVEERLLRAVWSGEDIVSTPQFSNVTLPDGTQHRVTNYPTMFTASPIKNQEHQIVAILILRVDPFEEFIAILNRARIGETGETYAFDGSGTMVSESRFNKQLQQMGLLAKDEFSMLNIELRVPGTAPSNSTTNERPMTYMAQRALKGEDGVNLEGYLDYRGIKVVGAWLWNDTLGFGLVTEMGLDEAYVTVRTSRYIFVFFCLSLVIGFVVAIAITEQRRFRLQGEIATRKLKEQQLRDSIAKSKELMASLNFQKSALDEHAIVSITDRKGDISYVNDKFCKVSGYSREELMGQNHRMVKSTEHSLEFYKNLWGTILKGKVWHGEIKNLKKDGGYYWVDATIVPFLNEQGEPYQYISIRSDITARILAENGMRRSQKMEAVGQLTGGIAHDFNNILGIVIGNLDLIGRRLESGSKLKLQLEKARSAALRGATMTKRLLSFSRQSVEAFSPVNVGDVVKQFKELISKSLTASVSIEVFCAEDLWMVDLNPDDFEDALINLSLNARDAMPEGGKLVIEINNVVLSGKYVNFKEDLEPGEYVEVTVSDTGTGMPNDIAENIFDPFFTTKGKDKGTGLGLSMVYGFVKRSHGYIGVYSEVDVGTTFRMYLPRSVDNSQHAPVTVDVDTVLPRGNETILIVDDELELAAIAQDILDNLGYTTICAHSGPEAQQMLADNRGIDLVFSDVVMPGGMSGFDLADAIGKEYPDLKIILTSGFTGKINSSESAKKLIKTMVMKPYRDIELANRVRQVLDSVQ